MTTTSSTLSGTASNLRKSRKSFTRTATHPGLSAVVVAEFASFGGRFSDRRAAGVIYLRSSPHTGSVASGAQ